MFWKYIESILVQAIYEKDDNWIIIAKVPWYAGHYAQGNTFEEARENLVDVIEIMMLDSIKSGEIDFIQQVKNFSSQNLEYA
jgi:predicted RNase H-like HicB family nuclease